MSAHSQLPAEGRRRTLRYLYAFAALAALAVLFVAAMVVGAKLRNEVWTYYADDSGNRVGVGEGKARAVLWEDPKQNSFAEKRDPAAPAVADPVNQPGGRIEAAFSPNGTMMVLVRRDPTTGENADLYLSQWDGRTWSHPEPLASINSASNDRGPAFSQDGRYLYFTSDRAGGAGGYDLYVARWDGKAWGGVESLGQPVNTAANELGPALSADGKRLYFSSDRNGKREDIFVAQSLPGETADPKAPAKPVSPPLPPLPKFVAADSAGPLNSAADDVEAVLTARGDHIFLASDRDRTEKSGFGIYLSRVIAGQTQPPEKVDLYFKAGDTSDPAVRMDGFELLFSADEHATAAGAEPSKGYRLYHSTTREVVGYTDLSRWELFKKLMGNIGWRIVLAIAALAALIYLLERWRDLTSLYAKCLAGSAAIHLGAIFLMMLWLVSKELRAGGESQSPEIAISIDALAQETLALESAPEQAKMAEIPGALVTDKLESDFKIPRFEPVVQTKTTPIVASTAKTSLVADVRLSKANTAAAETPVPMPAKDLPMLSALPATVLPEPETPKLEESNPAQQQKAVEKANPVADAFVPTEAVPQVSTAKLAKNATPTDAPAQEQTKATEVKTGGAAVETKDTGGETVVAHRGLEATGTPPKLDGTGTLAAMALKLPGTDSRSNPLLPGKLETPKHELDGSALTKLIQKQRGKPSQETIDQLGGSDATERGIGLALEWLARNQEPEGRWDTRKHGGNGDYDTASTGLALLCFYGWGVSHTAEHKYQGNIRKGIDWLVAQQKPDGNLDGPAGRMYAHGIAAIALCEAYGVSKDPALKAPAEKAIALIIFAQSPKGGWRYTPKPADADTSVTGWQYMALHSARMAGLEVPEAVFENARKWLDLAGGGKHGGLYGYTGPANNNPAMIATGMFCRQLDLVSPTDPRMIESAEALKMHPMNVRSPEFYGLYYATLALYQHQGPIWTEWNDKLKEALPLLQKKDGDAAGSWDPTGGHTAAGGRVVSTTMATLSLEVYYRLLPMYGFGNKDLPPPKQKDEIPKKP
ncbi:MAG: hypothetical protein DVB27_07165 [Verrucomicrobia bacterium]|nr:MAG: hypothetical protein DVB27_07165 [Verrucomicrobiota bacterium]